MSQVTGQARSTSTLHVEPSGGESSHCSFTCVDVQASGGALEPLGTKCATELVECTTSRNQRNGKRKMSETTGFEHQSPNADTKADGQDACRSRTRLTKGEKLDVLKLRDAKIQVSEIARRLSCGERTVYDILKNKSALQEEAKSPGFNDARKSERPSRYPKVEEGVRKLLNQARAHRLPVTQATITSFAETAKRRLLSGEDLLDEEERTMESFRASPTWVKNFVRRQGVMGARVHGEADGVFDENPAAGDGVEQVKAACGGYKLRNIFQVGETALFFRLLPRRLYMVPHEGRKTIRGMRDMGPQHRVTVYVCANATGSAKAPVSIVGKSKTPRCFEGKRVPVKYFSQSNAWSDAKTFRKWFHEVFLPFARKHTRGDKTHDKVLLLVDSRGTPDQLIDPEGRVRVMMYPPGCTSKRQPMDVGVIAATKVNYRRRLLERMTEILPDAGRLRAMAKGKKMRAGTQGLSEGQHPHMLDVSELISLAWNDVTDKTISRCWARADTLPTHYQKMLYSEGSTGPAFPEQGMAEIPELGGVVLNLGRALAALEDVETDPNVKELADSLRGLGIKPGDCLLDQSALGALVNWVVVEDQDDIVEALRLDMQGVLEEETDLRATDNDQSHAENDDPIDVEGGEGLSRILSREEVLKHLDAVEEFVATCDHDDFLRHLRRYRTTLSASFTS